VARLSLTAIAMLAAAVLALGAGCHTPPDAAAARRAVLLDVPPCPGTNGLCGVAAVRSVLAYCGRTPLAATEPAAAEPPFPDTLHLTSMLRAHGLHAELGAYELATVVADLRAGRPVVVVVPPGSGLIFRRPSRAVPAHCWVLRGVDSSGTYLYYNDPSRGPLRIRARQFARLWRHTGCAAIRVNRE
jgi:hypothetical protein